MILLMWNFFKNFFFCFSSKENENRNIKKFVVCASIDVFRFFFNPSAFFDCCCATIRWKIICNLKIGLNYQQLISVDAVFVVVCYEQQSHKKKILIKRLLGARWKTTNDVLNNNNADDIIRNIVFFFFFLHLHTERHKYKLDKNLG
jgi:hypothetical protein